MSREGSSCQELHIVEILDVTNVNSSDPFELTITTIECENRVQLKAALTEDRY